MAAEGGPRVDIRVQELFGVTTHPTVGGGRVPLTLALLSPARRPIQMTKDLPGFWRGSWKDVRVRDARPLSAPPLAREPGRGAADEPGEAARDVTVLDLSPVAAASIRQR